ncbi:MAG: FAD-dependent oxidoreductase [Caldilineaceae bacterium]|nr:FAD-dependent oxidoreductase [Caldilineaceae bacterium]
MKDQQTDILVVGGGLGGVAAALAACKLGRRVIMTEETDWIGGQLTAQAVPPDEHPWISTTGRTASYGLLREKIRDYYRRNYPLTQDARNDVLLNPGNGNVSALCHEPRIALAAMEEMLAPYRADRQLDVWLNCLPVAAETDGDRITAVTLRFADGDEVVVSAPYIIDATELGDLLELAGVEHVIGAESQAQTGELHAVEGDPDPLDQQAVTWCFAVDHFPGEDHTIARPADYDFWREYQADFWPGKQLGWKDVHPITLETRDRGIFHGPGTPERPGDFWHYRRIFYPKYYPDGRYASGVTLVNWPQIDYWLGPLLGVSEEQTQEHLRQCRELSFSFLYWMQTDAPRHDGKGYGYPGLRLRGDLVGTRDGLAKYVYVREARRIQAEFIVTEEHVGTEQRTAMGLDRAAEFHDTVGTGSYRIDLHPSTKPRTYVDVSSFPFQIPLGALIPVRMENMLPACKNLGVTHITNGCYRLHPVEWNIGEAAGALAAWCLNHDLTPRQVRNDADRLADFQRMLRNSLGFVLEWPTYAAITPR